MSLKNLLNVGQFKAASREQWLEHCRHAKRALQAARESGEVVAYNAQYLRDKHKRPVGFVVVIHTHEGETYVGGSYRKHRERIPFTRLEAAGRALRRLEPVIVPGDLRYTFSVPPSCRSLAQKLLSLQQAYLDKLAEKHGGRVLPPPSAAKESPAHDQA